MLVQPGQVLQQAFWAMIALFRRLSMCLMALSTHLLLTEDHSGTCSAMYIAWWPLQAQPWTAAVVVWEP
jgi:hypothetical protein